MSGSVQSAPASQGPSRARALVSRFRKSDHGATAVEFAFVAPLLPIMLFAIVGISLVFFADVMLENAAKDASRQLMTGEIAKGTPSFRCIQEPLIGEASMAMKMDMVKPTPARRPTGQTPRHETPGANQHHPSRTASQLPPTTPIGFPMTRATSTPSTTHLAPPERSTPVGELALSSDMNLCRKTSGLPYRLVIPTISAASDYGGRQRHPPRSPSTARMPHSRPSIRQSMM